VAAASASFLQLKQGSQSKEKLLAQSPRLSSIPPLMSKNSGLAKTRKAVAKRFKVTGTGKVMRRRQGKRHLLENKSRKRKKSLSKSVLVADVDVKAIKANLPFH
jgi:large subunit ribosomal protein L35